jgi:hypothetical protein
LGCHPGLGQQPARKIVGLEVSITGDKEMNPFITFMASGTGRLLRIVAGIVLIAIGLLVVQNTGGIILAIIGLVPLLAGILDVCVFAPLFGNPFSGPKIRAGK